MVQMLAQDLAIVSIFRNLNSEQLAQIVPLIEPCRFSSGDFVFEQGDPAESLFIVVQGEVNIRYKAYDGPVMSVARVGPGGVFGWSAALGRDLYTSSAVCTADSQVFRIKGRSLHHLNEQDPETGAILQERLAIAIAGREAIKQSQVVTMLAQNADFGNEYPRRDERDDDQ
jgi:CRP/FNR family transcriptional regulator, cyclic AMP receptor protein